MLKTTTKRIHAPLWTGFQIQADVSVPSIFHRSFFVFYKEDQTSSQKLVFRFLSPCVVAAAIGALTVKIQWKMRFQIQFLMRGLTAAAVDEFSPHARVFEGFAGIDPRSFVSTRRRRLASNG